jgi:hypothetical protein
MAISLPGIAIFFDLMYVDVQLSCEDWTLKFMDAKREDVVITVAYGVVIVGLFGLGLFLQFVKHEPHILRQLSSTLAKSKRQWWLAQ